MQQTNLHIAAPCHEDWGAMTPTDMGKFCTSCSKQVVDFTVMSDTQILKFLAEHKGGLCGRFDAGQLSRPLVEPAVSKQKSWYLALALPFSLFVQKCFGQKEEITMGKPAVKVEHKSPAKCGIIMGAPIAPVLTEWITLHGIIKDEKGNAVENASVKVKGTLYSCVADSAGRFSVKMRREKDSVVLKVSSIGYQPMEKKVSLEEAKSELVLICKSAEVQLRSVVVTSNGISGRLGAFSMYSNISRIEKRDSTVRKLLRLNPFTVYPNPARSGSQLQINCKKAGGYEIQLLSNASALIKTEIMQVSSDGATMMFQLPQLAAGVYYVRFISGDKKHLYLEKILVN